MIIFNDFDKLEVIAPNFKRRLSGVTSTIIQLVPVQNAAGITIATIGPGLPNHLPKIRYRDLWKLWKKPNSGKNRVWHARRNTEMLAGFIMRDVLRMPVKLVFTSAAQRNHSDYTKWLIRRMDSIIATSGKSGAFLEVPHSVIMHGIDTDRFVPPASKDIAKQALHLDSSRKIVGCTGRVRPSKGTDFFVGAMLELLPQHPQWDAVITGRTTAEFSAFKSNLEVKITAAGMQDRIHFCGEVPDILPWYQAFDLFVASSRNEGFGLTPLEAMSCGVPVVTSTAGSFEEMVKQGKNGFIATKSASKELSAAISDAFDYIKKDRFNLSSIRQAVEDEFKIENEADRINKIYIGLMEPL